MMHPATEQMSPPESCPDLFGYEVETLWEQGSGELNEDVLLREGNLFGVFDGATSLGRQRFCGCLTGGLLAARTAARTFREKPGNLIQLAALANRRIGSKLRAESIPLTDRRRLWATSLAVIRIGENHIEYCQIGDAMILLVDCDGGFRAVIPPIDIDRETLDLWKKSSVPKTTGIHDHLADQILQVRLQMNVSYGSLNGEPEALRFLRSGYIDPAGVRDVLLFTDGLFLPREYPLENDDWRSLVGLYRQGGLRAVRDHVRELQREDPDCRKYPRFKQHDDIAAVAIRLRGSRQ
ncbi:MAG: protein phosphatase 2C domain-containing protein [Acidobacteria bacterium]|nr:protein phosphatase 2C domain-containing protein [Acidobacteriota bacterium]